MYQDFFGLRELPFELTPNPRYLFLSPRHREALANLRHGMTTAKGISLLVGEAGTGKTTLIRAVLDEALEAIRPVYVNNPTLTRDEFVELLSTHFGLSDDARHSKAAFLIELERKLAADREAKTIRPLIVDEAQSLPHDLLEEIRLLANIETNTHKLLPVVLAGQPELADKLNETGLRQLKQRVALRCTLEPLSLAETASYIAARLRVAGGDAGRVFTRGAVMLIYERSRGIPRTISVLCDNALVTGFALNLRPVNREIVVEVCRDFDLHGHATSAARSDEPQSGAAEPRPAPARAAAHSSFLFRSIAGEHQASADRPGAEKKRRFFFFARAGAGRA